MNKSPNRYPIIEGISDWLTAYILSGLLMSLLGVGSLLAMFGLSIFLIVFLTFMMHNYKLKFNLYLFALVAYVIKLIVMMWQTEQSALTNAWLIFIIIGMTQAILTVRYYRTRLAI